MAEQVLLCSLNYKGGPADADDSLAELARLTETAGGVVCWSKVFTRPRPDAALFLGAGQVQDLKREAQNHHAQLVIFDHELKPNQLRNLENTLELAVIDRTQLILDIFAKRAKSYEGKLQVELAQLNYLLPRLVGLGLQLSRLGGGIGTRGPGETKLELDRRHLRDRIAALKRQLETLKRTRELHHQERAPMDMPLLSLIGYTNAGKSALLRLLTREDTLVEDQLFATLDLTTRKLVLPPSQEVLLTDTVGFIRRLPHHLVAAFRSTLEEATRADLLLKVVDCSDRLWEKQLQTVDEVLKELKVDNKPYLLVFNKTDKVGQAFQKVLRHQFPEAAQISALTTAGRDELLEKIKINLSKQWQKITLRLPYDEGELRANLLKRGRLIRETFGQKMISLTMELPQETIGQLAHWRKEKKNKPK